MRRQARLEKLLSELPVVGGLAERGVDATKAAIREMWEPTAFFEALGVRYAGPFDGHDIAAVEMALNNAIAMSGGPQVIHVMTQKGRGYAPAENDPIKRLHDTSQTKPGSFTAAFTEALIAEGTQRPELVAITAAMPDSTGLLAFSEQFPGRMIDVGIAEQHAVTAAAGMARGGLRPVFAVYSTFLTRAFDQVNLDVGLHGEPVVFCLDRAGITGDDGPSHHGVLDMVLLTKVPGMTVFAPSSYQEVGQMLHDALEISDGPSAIRWAKTDARHVGPDEVGSGLNARQLLAGTELCIISIGKMLDAAEAAAMQLASEGISVSLWDARVVKPLDINMLTAAAEHPFVITIEDGLRDGGVGSAISDSLSELTIGRTPPRVRTLGVPTQYIAHGKPAAILSELGLDAAGITESARLLCRAEGNVTA
jgi:1-deoxy-D-xylulose-5-phosphate synthase